MKLSLIVVSALPGAASLLLAGVASAAEADESTVNPAPATGFGRAGEVVLGGSTSAYLAHSEASSLWISRTTATVSPAVDVFVVGGLSVGAATQYGYSKWDRQPVTNSFGIGPRVGYVVSLGERFSLWPSVFAQYGATWGEGWTQTFGAAPSLSAAAFGWGGRSVSLRATAV
jgi:hypothetical protein